MNAVICNESALAFLDNCARLNPTPEYRHTLATVQSSSNLVLATTKRELRAIDLSRFKQSGSDLDILAPKYAHTHKLKGYHFHSAGGILPPSSLFDAGGGVLVCAAPLVFVQMCKGLSLARAIRLGNYMAASYTIEKDSQANEEKLVERHPLLTTMSLAQFLQSYGYLYGSRRAKAALPWILENAASPQETNLALKFMLPHKLGGLGFSRPILNYPIHLSREARAIEPAHTLKIDVYWPEHRIGLEYNSYAFHAKRIGEDVRRSLALEAMGIHVEFVTKAQLDSPRQLQVLARLLEKYGVERV